jgi:hypothetical protein
VAEKADKFKVQAVRPFRAMVDGSMQIVNPGDVVELASKDDYFSVLSTLRAKKADDNAPVHRVKGYVPEYKKQRLTALTHKA